MIISRHLNKLFTFICFSILFLSNTAKAQKLQQIGFVDMEYILTQIPTYNEAQEKLNADVAVWKENLNKMYLKLDTSKKEFLNEKPLLTDDLIKEREEEIKREEHEITKVENTYFGTEGKLFELRKELVTPFQDLVYNAVQSIAKNREYDMIFEKSSGLTMLYTNNNYDISDLVLRYINKTKQDIEREEAELKKKLAREARARRIEEQKKKREEQRLQRLKK
ncbi:OmpH family outer membrane protein [Flavobacteriaceae bacterium]|nr:OmpH family outer membrane protein [Flavobacteriaceae bacterium]